MVVPCMLRKPKKRLLLLVAFLFSSLCFFVFHATHPTENETSEVLPALAVTWPADFDRLLPESAAACTEPAQELVAFVHSSPNHVPHRKAIRKTWGSPAGGRMRTVFVVGRSENQKVWQRVQKEAQEHKDLVLLDLLDTYQNLTLKHLAGIRWVLSNCPQTPYVLKSDDDIFIDTLRLSSLLNALLGSRSGSKNSLVCHVIPEGSPPKRSGKWAVSKHQYPFDEYPEYCSGQAYFARATTMKRIGEATTPRGMPHYVDFARTNIIKKSTGEGTTPRGIPRYIGIDDVLVTGLAAALAGVERQDLGVRFASNDQQVMEWLRGASPRPCPWMVAEMSPSHWPRLAAGLWNKTVKSWRIMSRHDALGAAASTTDF